MAIPAANRTCLYCGNSTGQGRKGEHILPKAIGGALTLNDVSDRVVCSKCNNGVLSELDKELCSRSHLSIIASQKIAAHLWQAWDVDHKANNLLVEARPSWADDEAMSCMVCYPQLIFERSGLDVRADAEEVERFGGEEFRNVLFKAARRCFERYCGGERSIHFERIKSDIIGEGYRLPPRLFAPHSIREIARKIDKQSFILRFTSEGDRRFALQSLTKLDAGRSHKAWASQLGSHFPSVCVFFDIADTLRALMKMGLNLIAAYCPNTPVNHQSFRHPLQIIMGAMPIPREVLQVNGFVRAEDVQCIKAGECEHSFRLLHINGVWHVYSSFFGGSMGSFVRLVGPNREDWVCADIVAPVKSKDWKVRTSPILQPLEKRVVWTNWKAIIPSVKLLNTGSSVHLELSRKK